MAVTLKGSKKSKLSKWKIGVRKLLKEKLCSQGVHLWKSIGPMVVGTNILTDAGWGGIKSFEIERVRECRVCGKTQEWVGWKDI